MLSLAYKRFDEVVPEPGDPSRSSAKGLDAEDRALLEQVEAGFETVGELYNACKFRAAPSVALGLPRGHRGGQAWAHAVRPYKRTVRRRQRPACTSSCGSWTT